MADLYYHAPTGEAYSPYDLKRKTGVDIDINHTTEYLNGLKIYPVTGVTQPYNTDLYTVAQTFVINGTGADQTWTPTAKVLTDILDYASNKRIQCIIGRLATLRESSGYDGRILLAVASQLLADRDSRFSYWVTRFQDTVTELNTDLSSIEGAADVDSVNDIVSPAWGTVALALDKANPLNLLAGDFEEFYSKSYSKADMELHFPSTNTTITYSSGFAAAASAVTATDATVQLRVTATGVVVDEIRLYPVESASFAAGPENYARGFGYKEYDSNIDPLY